MARFHIKKDGMPGKCTATQKACPLGGSEIHFDSLIEAAQAIEARHKEKEMPKPVRKEAVDTAAERIIKSNNLLSETMAKDVFLNGSEELFKPLVEADKRLQQASTRQEEREAQRAVNGETNKLVRNLFEIENSTYAMPARLKNMLWDKAWADGHSSGYNDVRVHYEEYADIAATALDVGLNIQ